MISAESKILIANALLMDSRMKEDAMDEKPGTEWADVWSNIDSYPDVLNGYCCALMELEPDTDQLRWIHDRIASVASQAEKLVQEVQADD